MAQRQTTQRLPALTFHACPSHLSPTPRSYLQDLAELGLELKVGAALANGSPEGLLQGLHPSFSLLAQPRYPLVLPLTTEPLLFRLVHLAQVGRMTHITELGDLLLPSSPTLGCHSKCYPRGNSHCLGGHGFPQTENSGSFTCLLLPAHCRLVLGLLGGCRGPLCN